jgi:ketosteroid isomerase-like protein
MGQLSFSDIDITVLAPDAALAFGHWHLKRGNDQTGGVFTLLFRKTNAGWRIVHDHSSRPGIPLNVRKIIFGIDRDSCASS